MPFKQKGGYVCLDTKARQNNTNNFVPCNQTLQMVYRPGGERGGPDTEEDEEGPYPPLYESSEAEIYNLLNPDLSNFVTYDPVTKDGVLRPLAGNPVRFEKKGTKRTEGANPREVLTDLHGQSAYIVQGLNDYLKKPEDIGRLFNTSAKEDFQKLSDEGRDYLKNLILTSIRRRVNNTKKRMEIATAYEFPWPTQEFDRGGLIGPTGGPTQLSPDSYFATEDTPDDKVDLIYEAIAPNETYWKPFQLKDGPLQNVDPHAAAAAAVGWDTPAPPPPGAAAPPPPGAAAAPAGRGGGRGRGRGRRPGRGGAAARDDLTPNVAAFFAAARDDLTPNVAAFFSAARDDGLGAAAPAAARDDGLGAAAPAAPAARKLAREKSAIQRFSAFGHGVEKGFNTDEDYIEYMQNISNSQEMTDPPSAGEFFRGGPGAVQDGWGLGPTMRQARAPRGHNINALFNLGRGLSLIGEGDVKRALLYSDFHGDDELQKARKRYENSLKGGGKRKGSKNRTKKRKSIKKKKKATRR